MSGLPDSGVHGPGQGTPNGKDVQIWERPWTLDEMRQTGANWSLAADSGLFLFLQEFSQRMLSKTHEIEKQLDGLIRDTKAADCCLHTVFNDFLMLSNTQFIENRVYDEEVEDSLPKPEVPEKQPEQEKTREQKEAELIPKMQEAVNYGLKVLDSAFEQLDIKAGNSDSEDEEATDRVEPILEPKDLYVDRPLPYLIGSQPFMEQEDVGLGDLSSEEMSIDSDRDSVMESEDGKEADQSDEDFDQEDEDEGSIKKKSSMLSFEEEDEEDEDGDSDIFGDSDKDDNDDEERKKTVSSSFADELAARIKGETASKSEGDFTSLSSASKKSKGKTEPKPARVSAADNDSNQLFEPPKMEDEDFSPFGGKSGLFSGGKGLFDDDDDEGDLFSDAPKHPVAEEKAKNTGQTSDETLFGLGNDADSFESKENGNPVKSKTQPAPKAASTGVVGGLFDDDEDDSFFGSKSLKKSSSAGQEKVKGKKTVDLFGGDDEEGDIFNESSRAPPPLQSKKEVVDEQAAPGKKMPAGAISMFGPGTKSLLTEGLRKRRPSTSEESEKSEENGPSSDIKAAPAKPTEKPQTRGLFSDDEDTQIFPTIPKSQSKPETTSKNKTNNAPLSLFNDEEEEEEEDLFASAEKSKSRLAKATTSSSLFSDEEDQWMTDKPVVGAPEAKPGGMKPSVSAPSSLFGVKASKKSSLFDDDNDDLFGAVKETSQKKPQRASLLFQDEDEDVDDKGSLFGSKPAVNNNAPSPVDKPQASASKDPSLLALQKGTVPQEGTFPGEEIEAPKKPDVQSSLLPPEASEAKKKPIGAVSLFGGIDVLAQKTSKSPLDEVDGEDDFLFKDSHVEKEKKGEKEEQDIKAQNKTLSLFDEEDDDWTAPTSIPSSKPDSQNILKAAEEQTHTKRTGVFQDEELLFSQTQQKDNDPDVDLFATPAKTVSAKPSSSKSSAPTLFGDDDDDDLFSSKAPPPKVADKPRKPTEEGSTSKPVAPVTVPESQKPATSPVKANEPSSQIGKIKTNLLINPATLLPGAVPRITGGVSVLPGLAPAASLGVQQSPIPSPITSSSPVLPVRGAQAATGEGVSFDIPAQVTTLQSANKGRTKGSVRRRPQSRAARQQSAQNSIDQDEENQESSQPNPDHPRPALPNTSRLTPDQSDPTLPSPTNTVPTSALPFQPPLKDVSTRPSVLTLPVSTNPQKTESSKSISKPKVLPSPDDNDLFGSDGLFGSTPAPKLTTPSIKSETTTTDALAGSSVAVSKGKEKDSAPSIFDDHGDNLFQKVKPRSAQKTTALSFLEKEDDEEDIFGFGKGTTTTAAINSSANLTKKDIFQDQEEPSPQTNKKHIDKSLDASLFDDNVDIFADLTLTSKPKEKPSKKKVETKSIFGDDMDDIFSSGAAKPVAKTSVKPKKTAPALDTSAAEESTGNMFDDPLNALGGT